ncbi:hypothetical protein BGHDH14_bgh04342 [Blumeria hordei DH14]|uniref:Uncharacterized protein n=1 Tax=Blumeria graminis f. sp. hordei (strain DH14) TaxID=546991 RepID=N1JDY5_BLUG1|nr:hypothetical protein BGHDH14_bgh04342 [Blumeria hordei DH14]
MSLSRAFTVRRSNKLSDSSSAGPSRSLTTKRSHIGGTIRHKISAPMELISTTNMISYNAPNVPQRATSLSSISSDSDSSPVESISSISSTDSYSIESVSPTNLKPNHLSCYFGSPVTRDEPPSIPKRAPSHMKVKISSKTGSSTPKSALKHAKPSNEPLPTRQASLVNSMSPNLTSMARSSLNMFSPQIETVPQIVTDNEPIQTLDNIQHSLMRHIANTDPEEQELASRGLYKFEAEDYENELDELYHYVFGESKSASSMWI